MNRWDIERGREWMRELSTRPPGHSLRLRLEEERGRDRARDLTLAVVATVKGPEYGISPGTIKRVVDRLLGPEEGEK